MPGPRQSSPPAVGAAARPGLPQARSGAAFGAGRASLLPSTAHLRDVRCLGPAPSTAQMPPPVANASYPVGRVPTLPHNTPRSFSPPLLFPEQRPHPTTVNAPDPSLNTTLIPPSAPFFLTSQHLSNQGMSIVRIRSAVNTSLILHLVLTPPLAPLTPP